MAIVRLDPFREVAQLHDRLSRVIGDWYGRTGTDDGFMTTGEWVPPVDIYADGDHELVLKAELPGDDARRYRRQRRQRRAHHQGREEAFGQNLNKTSSIGSSVTTARSAAHSRCRRPSTPTRWRPSTSRASSPCGCRCERKPNRVRSRSTSRHERAPTRPTAGLRRDALTRGFAWRAAPSPEYGNGTGLRIE